MSHQPPPSRRILLTAALTAIVAVVSFDLRADPTTSPAAAPTTTPATTQATALTIGPISYFDTNCARCHGAYGSFYGGEFGKGLKDDKLRDVVRDMAEGPGNAPLADADLAAEVAYHRSLVKHTPFLAVVKSDAQEISGDVTPGATVTLTSDGKSTEATVTGHTFSVKPPSPVAADATIVAKLGDQTTTLNVRDLYTDREKLGN